jgi:hypothetical protein
MPELHLRPPFSGAINSPRFGEAFLQKGTAMERDNIVSVDRMVAAHVLLSGNSFEGFAIIGPFDNLTALRDWAEAHCKSEWWASPLIEPT